MLKLSAVADVIYLTVQEDLSVSGSSCWDVKCHIQLNQLHQARVSWKHRALSLEFLRWLFWCPSPGTSPAPIAWCWRAPLGLMKYHEHKQFNTFFVPKPSRNNGHQPVQIPKCVCDESGILFTFFFWEEMAFFGGHSTIIIVCLLRYIVSPRDFHFWATGCRWKSPLASV